MINICIEKKIYLYTYLFKNVDNLKTKNLEEAIKWFMLAAEQDEPIAQFNLGVAYRLALASIRIMRKL